MGGFVTKTRGKHDDICETEYPEPFYFNLGGLMTLRRHRTSYQHGDGGEILEYAHTWY